MLGKALVLGNFISLRGPWGYEYGMLAQLADSIQYVRKQLNRVKEKKEELPARI